MTSSTEGLIGVGAGKVDVTFVTGICCCFTIASSLASGELRLDGDSVVLWKDVVATARGVYCIGEGDCFGGMGVVDVLESLLLRFVGVKSGVPLNTTCCRRFC